MNKLHLNELKYTKEVYYCLEQSLRMKIEGNILETFHLCISLLVHSTLIRSLLNLNDQLLNRLFSRYFITNASNLKKKNLVMSKDIINIFTLLNHSDYICNTVVLFYFLLKNDYNSFKLISKIVMLNPLNTLLKYMRRATSIEIPLEFRKYICTNDILDEVSLIGREKEIKNIETELLGKKRCNIILEGREGVGKKALLINFVNSCEENRVCLVLNSFNLLRIKDTSLVDSLFDYLGSIEEPILYIQDFRLLFDTPSYDSLIPRIRDSLFYKIQKKELQILGEVTKKEEVDSKWLEQITVISIEQLNLKAVISLLYKYNKQLQLLHKRNISLPETTFETIFELGDKHINKYAFPKKGFMILDSLYNDINSEELTKDSIIKSIANYDSSICEGLTDRNTKNKLRELESKLKKRIYGQDNVVTKIFPVLKRSLTGIKDKTKPIGSFLFCGPSGTGKTELVKSLSDLFMKSSLIRFDMSEYMEKHSISKLIGCPPGYVGHEEGGLLTEAIKRKPCSVILFDEIEKAHSDINNIMLQLLDEGRITDSKGETIDCTNTIIIFTSNLGCPTTPDSFESYTKGTDVSEEEYKMLCSSVDKATKKFFKPEFLNRLDTVAVFKPLSIKYLVFILEKFVAEIEKKLKDNKIPLSINLTSQIKHLLAKIAYHPLYGARALKRIINQSVEKPISDLIINYVIKTPHLFSIFSKNKELNYSIQKV